MHAQMPKFDGLTNALRQDPEFKLMFNLVKAQYPHWPDYLAELAVCCHLTSPGAYKNEYKEDKARKHAPPSVSVPPIRVLDAVHVLDPEVLS